MMRPRILFIGGTLRGLKLIERLIARQEQIVFACILKEDNHEPIKVSDKIIQICKKKQIPYVLGKKIETDLIPVILKTKPDVAFVLGWRSIISKSLYEAIPQGCLTCHDSLLPKYRGFAPTAWAIIHGENHTGVTLFKIDDKGVDAGDIFAQHKISIGKKETASDVYPRIVKASVQCYDKYLNDLKKGSVQFKKQNEQQATYMPRRTPDDGCIDWNKPANEVFNFIRALNPPYPLSWTMVDGQKIYVKQASWNGRKIKQMLPAGTIKIKQKSVGIVCRDGYIEVKRVIDEKGREVLAQRILKEGRVH
jgi:methionyl-tRNA formyltransferase